MKLKKRSKRTSLIIATICIILALFLSGLLYINLFAQKEGFFSIETQNENIKFQIIKPDEQNQDLRLKRFGFFKDEEIKLDGFEGEVKLCEEQGVVKLVDSETAICLSGAVGVHSKNIQLIKVTGGKMQKIKILDSNEQYFSNTTSDVPSFNFLDFNSDGFLDFVLDQRDYDADPLSDYIRFYYKSGPFGFTFDSAKTMKYNDDGSSI